MKRFFQREEVEDEGVFQQPLSEVGMDLGQGLAEVRDGDSLAVMSLRFDLSGQDIASPALADHLICVPEPSREFLDFLNQYNVVAPTQLGKDREFHGIAT